MFWINYFFQKTTSFNESASCQLIRKLHFMRKVTDYFALGILSHNSGRNSTGALHDATTICGRPVVYIMHIMWFIYNKRKHTNKTILHIKIKTSVNSFSANLGLLVIEGQEGLMHPSKHSEDVRLRLHTKGCSN